MTVQEGELYEGRYRVLRALGEGGFGQTFVARDEERGEEVVLKTLRLDRAEDWKSVELFEREAKMLERLEHPGIPSYLDWFEAGEDAWCLVQRLAPGQTLAQRVGSGWSPTEEEAVELARQALEILVYLQGRHPPIVHRDIKPENVLLDEDGRVSLVDFGSVKSSSKGSRGSTVAGTFGYMAPEQLRGVANEQTDLFGLGSTLLFVMTGREPEDLPTSRLKIDTERAIPRASPELRAWFDRMIDPIDEERFADAARALEALDGEIEEAVRVAAPPAPVEVDPVSYDPVPDEELPARGGRHEELEELRGSRVRWAIAWAAVLLVGMLMHGFGVNNGLGSWIDSTIMAFIGAGALMPLGLLGLISAGARLARTRTQESVEVETGRALPVDAGSWFPVEVTRSGGSLDVRRRRGVLGSVLTLGPPAVLTWYASLVAADYGLGVAAGAVLKGLMHPVGMALGVALVVAYHLWKTKRPSFSVSEGGRWSSSEAEPVAREELESWRVVTRKAGDHERSPYEVSVRVKRLSSPVEERVFAVKDVSEEVAVASARLLHELIEEQVGGPERAVAEATAGVVFDEQAFERAREEAEVAR